MEKNRKPQPELFKKAELSYAHFVQAPSLWVYSSEYNPMETNFLYIIYYCNLLFTCHNCYIQHQSVIQWSPPFGGQPVARDQRFRLPEVLWNQTINKTSLYQTVYTYVQETATFCKAAPPIIQEIHNHKLEEYWTYWHTLCDRRSSLFIQLYNSEEGEPRDTTPHITEWWLRFRWHVPRPTSRHTHWNWQALCCTHTRTHNTYI